MATSIDNYDFEDGEESQEEQQSSPSESSLETSNPLCVVKMGNVHEYTIPSFSVITVKLRQAMIQVEQDSNGELKVLDVFFREDESLACVNLPLEVYVEESCSVNITEFARGIPNVKNLQLDEDEGVYIVWKWSIQSQQPENPQQKDVDCENSSVSSVSLDSEIDESDSGTHTVTFKCIGVTQETHYQDVLRAARHLMENNQTIPVRLQPELDNMFDPKAIAFHCHVHGRWSRIGYIAKELCDELQDALNRNKIVSIQFSWIKYITTWSRSGPGYFAGIDITRMGCWSSKVMRSCSTV